MQGVNIMAFCKDYNAATQSQIGTIIPVEITVFEVPFQAQLCCQLEPCTQLAMLQDRSFTFILKTPPASILLKKAAGIPKGSATPQGPAVGSVTEAQIRVRGMASRLYCITAGSDMKPCCRRLQRPSCLT